MDELERSLRELMTAAQEAASRDAAAEKMPTRPIWVFEPGYFETGTGGATQEQTADGLPWAYDWVDGEGAQHAEDFGRLVPNATMGVARESTWLAVSAAAAAVSREAVCLPVSDDELVEGMMLFLRTQTYRVRDVYGLHGVAVDRRFDLPLNGRLMPFGDRMMRSRFTWPSSPMEMRCSVYDAHSLLVVDRDIHWRNLNELDKDTRPLLCALRLATRADVGIHGPSPGGSASTLGCTR